VVSFDQVFRVEAFGEPAVYRRELIVRFSALAVAVPQASE